jgi:phosphocarrier protein HPr
LPFTDEKLARDVTICNRRGLHARASAKFAKASGSFDARIEVCKDATCVVGTSIMGLMMLGAAKGEVINISTSGSDAGAALEALCTLVQDRFGEEE